jgi:hypothetical protein
MFLASLVEFLTAFVNLARAIIDPCAPPFLGSYWLKCPLCYGPNPERNFITWVPILVLDFYFIIEILHKGLFYPIQIVFATTGRLVNYVDIMNRYKNLIVMTDKLSSSSATFNIVLLFAQTSNTFILQCYCLFFCQFVQKVD